MESIVIRMNRVMAALFTLVLLIGGITVSAADVSLGDIDHYNAILFGDLVSKQADIEGAVAVGGSAELGSSNHGYDIGAAGNTVAGGDFVYIGYYNNPNGYPTFLLGGGIKANNRIGVYAGSIVMKESYREGYVNGTFEKQPVFVNDKKVNDFFTNTRMKAARTTGVLAGANNRTITPEQLKNIKTLNFTEFENETIDTDAKIAAFTLDSSGTTTIREFYFDEAVKNYDVIIITLPGKDITFTGGGAYYNSNQVNTSLPRGYEGSEALSILGTRIIWNCPNAETITVQTGVTGSVIAPYAKVFGTGGSINGVLVADSLQQSGGMEVHSFKINRSIWDWDTQRDPKGSLELEKKDSGNREPLAGAEFALKDAEGKPAATLKTGKDGKATAEDLPYGTYWLVETKAPDGYQLEETPVEVKIDSITPVMQEVLNQKEVVPEDPKGSLELEKKDSENREPLAGAEFALKDAEGKLTATLKTGKDGKAIAEDLPYGTYWLVETKAPDGYQLDETPVEVKIDSITPVMQEVLNQKEVVPEDPKGSLELEKKDSGNREPLAGAEFALKDAEGKPAATLKTGKDGKAIAEDLPYGTYWLVETKAPDGYQLDETPVEVKIDSITPVMQEVLNQKEVVPEDPKGSLELEKKDSGNREPLAGAEFALKDAEGKPAATLKTGKDGKATAEDLPYGTYWLVETKAPDGYQLDETPVEVKIDSITPVMQEVLNQKEVVPEDPKGSLELEKKDSGNREPLAGAEFALKDAEGKPAATLKTGKDGKATAEDLPYGTYWLVETKAPDGYQLDETPVEVKIDSITPVMQEVLNQKERGPSEPDLSSGGSRPGGAGDSSASSESERDAASTSSQSKSAAGSVNKTGSMPKTGEGNWRLLIFVAAGSVAAAGIILYRKNRKFKK